MTLAPPPATPAEPVMRNFGVIRLALAYAVILSHSSEIIDGNDSREPLHRLVGTLTFGESAVHCFFLISGYLITRSFLGSSPGNYLKKRLSRIYPAFIVASLISLLVVPALVGDACGATSASRLTWQSVAGVFLLQTPELPDVFACNPYQNLNGSLWTIRYEFIAYLILMGVGLCGLLAVRWIFPVLALVLSFPAVFYHLGVAFGVEPATMMRMWDHQPFIHLLQFTGYFFAGTSFYLYRHSIRFSKRGVALSALGLVVGVMSSKTNAAAITFFGGYLLFWLAQRDFGFISQIGTRNDLSYGVYLYAWPIQQLFVWRYPQMSPWLLFVLASVAATVAAAGSWFLVERPALVFKRSERGAMATGLKGSA